MNTTRRNFIKASAFVAVFAAADLFKSPVHAASSDLPSELLADPLFYLTANDFKKHIGAQFSLIQENGVMSAELSSVVQIVKPPKMAQNQRGGARRKLTKETFTLSFRASDGNFSQTTYQVWHPSLGQFDLFLVPNVNDGNQTLLHAVINRI